MLCARHARKRHTEPQAFARGLNLRSWPLRLHRKRGSSSKRGAIQKRKKNMSWGKKNPREKTFLGLAFCLL